MKTSVAIIILLVCLSGTTLYNSCYFKTIVFVLSLGSLKKNEACTTTNRNFVSG